MRRILGGWNSNGRCGVVVAKTLGLFLMLILSFSLPTIAQALVLKGRVTDPRGNNLPGASVQLVDHDRVLGRSTSGSDGLFQIRVSDTGQFVVKVEMAGFRPVEQPVSIALSGNAEITVKMVRLSIHAESISVTADVNDLDVLSPDPAMKVFASENLLDANPGRPGAPISIPGYPIETASSGIKAPQYFAPGVAGDHGEPIAQYIQVGSYLVPNNLSANAHGNGYADPNIYIASVIESVQVDGGAYNVREGNHALNLGAIYGLRSHLDPFLTLTGDYRDITATAGMSPSANSWVAMEGSFGNGFLGPSGAPQTVQAKRRASLPCGRPHADAVRNRIPRLRLRGRTEADLRIQFRSMLPPAG